MNPLDATVHTLQATTTKAIGQLWQAFTAGKIDLVTFQTGTAAVITQANATGSAVGLLALAANLTAKTGVVVPPEPVKPPAYLLAPGRIERATETILSSDGDPQMQLQRMAAAEPVEAVQKSYGAGIAKSKLTEGWERGLEIDACELCTWWWREGRIWPKEHPMPTHKGCNCMPVPKLSHDIEKTAAMKAREREERAIANRDRSSSIVRKLIEEGKL